MSLCKQVDCNFLCFKTKNSQKLIKDTESHHNEKICTGKFQLLNQSFNTFKNVVSILRQRYNSDNNYKTSWLHEDPTKKQHFTCLSFKIKNNIHKNILMFFTGQVFGPSGITTGEKWVTIIGPQATKRPKRFYFVIWVFSSCTWRLYQNILLSIYLISHFTWEKQVQHILLIIWLHYTWQ